MRILKAGMRVSRLLPLLGWCWPLLAAAGTPAVFRGEVVRTADAGPHIIFVMGRNGSLRKVHTGGARISYDESVPVAMREHDAARALKHGAEVRVEADENGDGMWRARSIEIVRAAGQKPPPPPSGPTSSHTPVLSQRQR
jgi:hypothetical protein